MGSENDVLVRDLPRPPFMAQCLWDDVVAEIGDEVFARYVGTTEIASAGLVQVTYQKDPDTHEAVRCQILYQLGRHVACQATKAWREPGNRISGLLD